MSIIILDNPTFINWRASDNSITEIRVVTAIETGHLLDVLPHPNANYKHQFIFVIEIDGYVVYVPFVEDEEKIFLKTAFHNRKATRDYFRSNQHENE